MEIREMIERGKTTLGIELGSTRIKAVLIGADYAPIASGSYEWENQYENQIWTYHLEDVINGLQACYRKMAEEVEAKYNIILSEVGAIGISAMMHGYMAFDKEGSLLVPFRTWRNTMTEEAAGRLTDAFQYNIPQRWSIAHLYQAILNQEPHVHSIDYMTTLAGYVHWQLTGERVLGIDDASGMFPIDSAAGDFDAAMMDKFDALVRPYSYPWQIRSILPKVLCAGTPAGTLSAYGAKLLDPAGRLKPGIPLCPPEGDAGTGMAATNSVGVRTGNVSAGTSIFAMIVMEKALKGVHTEIDLVTTPEGHPVAMVHCNNCTSDLNAWVQLFKEFAESFGIEANMDRLFEVLYSKALEGDKDCGGLIAYNYFSGEPVTGFDEGRPLFVRRAGDHFSLPNFMRMHLYSALATLKIGLDILFKEEDVTVDKMYGHGGLFKTKGVGQRLMAAAMNTPVSVMETAGEGGAWGIALLAAYMADKAEGESLSAYLENKVFKKGSGSEIAPDRADAEGFERFMENYKAGLDIERAAIHCI